jgi:hypothetical protein
VNAWSVPASLPLMMAATVVLAECASPQITAPRLDRPAPQTKHFGPKAMTVQFDRRIVVRLAHLRLVAAKPLGRSGVAAWRPQQCRLHITRQWESPPAFHG